MAEPAEGVAEGAAERAAEGARALTLLRAGGFGDSPAPVPLPSATAGRDDRSDSDSEEVEAERGVDISGDRKLPSAVDLLNGPMDVERVCVKLEAARARLSGPWSEIPVGRVYDTPPDSAEEKAYDALEKAYDQAFHVAGAVQREQTGSEDQPVATAIAASGTMDQESDTKAPAATEPPQATTIDSSKDGRLTTSSTKAIPGRASEMVEDSSRVPAPSSQSPPLQTIQSAVKQAAELEAPMDGASSAGDGLTEESQSMTDGETEASRTTEDGVQAEAATPVTRHPGSLPKQPGINGLTGSTEASITPPDVKDSERYDDASTIDPNRGQRTSTDGDGDGDGVVADAARGSENQALNDFLIAELQLFVDRLLGLDSVTDTQPHHDIAHVTSLQLYHNHQRALMDFVADRKRYDAWTKLSLSSNAVVAGSLALVEPPAVLCQNPFQNRSPQPGKALWSALLKTVRPFAPPDSEEAPVTPSEWETNPLFMRAIQLHEKGLNAVTVKRGDGDRERRLVAMFLAQLASTGLSSCLCLVVCAASNLRLWQEVLCLNESLQVYRCWGARADRQEAVKSLNEQYGHDRLKTQVVLTSFEAYAEDSDVLSSLPFQLAVVDTPDSQRERAGVKWTCVLSQRCRQRIFMCPEGLDIDARQLLHFVVPGLFSSRRKLLAWNYAALDLSQIQAVCRVIETFSVLSDDETVHRFASHLAVVTQENSMQELAALAMLHKQGAARSATPHGKIQTKSSALKKVRNRASSSTPVKKAKTAEEKDDSELVANSPTSSQLSVISLKKRRGSRSGRRLRKRIRRCGKCPGCLSEDCMVCGHCKDMKKYGGPGLRKQSCKNRKCLNPTIWGFASKRRKHSGKADSATDDADDLSGSMLEDSDMYDDLDDMTPSCSSMDSDRESTLSSLRLSTRSGADSDSDAGVSSRLSDEESVDSPRSMTRPLPPSGAVGGDSVVDPSDPSDSTGEDRSRFLSVIQQCAVFVEPRLVFQCAVCSARFCSKPFLDFHKRVEHSQPWTSDNAVAAKLDREASRLFLHPITQNAVVASQLRQQDRSQRACPLGYAKLEGPDFQYFFIEPYVVLGRLESYWRGLYKDLGVRDLKGLPGGAVDCHLGNDRTIAEQHALISWDAQRGQFAISCLSAHWPISVDGQVVSFSSPPVAIPSRALVQIGASTFYFLLPRAEPGARRRASRRPRISRDDARAWVHAAVEKRRTEKQ